MLTCATSNTTSSYASSELTHKLRWASEIRSLEGRLGAMGTRSLGRRVGCRWWFRVRAIAPSMADFQLSGTWKRTYRWSRRKGLATEYIMRGMRMMPEHGTLSRYA